eukprot:3393978-Lingulodinium_polyedra.AAC.1
MSARARARSLFRPKSKPRAPHRGSHGGCSSAGPRPSSACRGRGAPGSSVPSFGFAGVVSPAC